ncbi:MAG TPA: hypothetical protein V6D09_25680 [Leptolyngbyaceae cyanobacterium]
MEVESILLPLAMFHDLMRDKSNFSGKLLEVIQNDDYKSKPEDSKIMKLFVWLKSNSLFWLIETDKSSTNAENSKANS